MTQIQLLFDQERKSTRPGDVELLKRVIRSEEGTFTGQIRALEAELNQTPVETDNFAFIPKTENQTVENTTVLN